MISKLAFLIFRIDHIFVLFQNSRINPNVSFVQNFTHFKNETTNRKRLLFTGNRANFHDFRDERFTISYPGK